MMKNDFYFANKMVSVLKLTEDETEYLLGKKLENKSKFSKESIKKSNKKEEILNQKTLKKNLEKQQRLFAL